MSSAQLVETDSQADVSTDREGHGLAGYGQVQPARGDIWDPKALTAGVTHTFRGRTVEELIPRIQAELGADAIILSRRQGLTGGFAGFFQRPFVEIDAVAGGPRLDIYDEDDTVLEISPAAMSTSESSPQATRAPFYTREPPGASPYGAYVSEDLAALAQAGPPEPTPPFENSPTSAFQELVQHSPRDLLEPFAAALTQASAGSWTPTAGPHDAVTQAQAPAPAQTSAQHLATTTAPPPRSRAQASVQARLVELGISESFAQELIDGALAHVLALAPRTGLTQAVRSALIQRIPVMPPLPTSGAAIALVGPGGAGKTSCAAALLRAYRKSGVLPASCASLVRGSKRGELEMLLSPYVMQPISSESRRAIGVLGKARGAGLLILDTPPLSAGDRSGIRKLTALLGELKPERVVVALPATLGAVAAAQLLEALHPLGPNALAVTHADETDQIGVAVEAACKFGLAPEYLLDRGRSGGWRLGPIDPAELGSRLLP